MSEEPGGGRDLSVYEERDTCGLYEELVDALTAMGPKALGNIDCPDDFIRHMPAGYSSNIEFRDKEGFEFRTLIVGEIAAPIHGTVLRATGNFFASNDFKPIDDTKVNVKDILALTMPTSAPMRMANYYENQTVPLRAAIDHELGIEMAADPPEEFLLRPWLRSTEENSNQDDLIVVHMLPKYGIPASAGAAVVTPCKGKRKLDDDNPRSAAGSAAPSAQPSAASQAREICKPIAADIKLGAFYDPRLLPDYGGAYFRHVKAKLLQLDVRDGTEGANNALIPPYEFYDRLKVGTLVLVSASLHIFVMSDTDAKGAPRAKRRKVYQINAHSIKVLADSNEPVEQRLVMIPRNSAGASSVPTPAPVEFAQFNLKSSPTKAKPKPSASSDGGAPSGGEGSSSGPPEPDVPGPDEDDLMGQDIPPKPPAKRTKKAPGALSEMAPWFKWPRSTSMSDLRRLVHEQCDERPVKRPRYSPSDNDDPSHDFGRHHPQSRFDPFINLDVQIVQGPLRGQFAAVTATSPDEKSVSVRTEARAVNTILNISVSWTRERHTGLELHEYLRTSRTEREILRARRQLAWAEIAGRVQFGPLNPFVADVLFAARASGRAATPPLTTVHVPDLEGSTSAHLPLSDFDPTSAWTATSSLCAPVRLALSLSSPLKSAPAPSPRDTYWLLAPALRGKYLDVLISKDAGYRGHYDDTVGVIEELPEIKRGRRGSVKVKFGVAAASRRSIKISCVLPLHTNELEGSVSRAAARSVFDINDVGVVIIGPDSAGSSDQLGEKGYTVPGGRIWIQDKLYSFPLSSICRLSRGKTCKGAELDLLLRTDEDFVLYALSVLSGQLIGRESHSAPCDMEDTDFIPPVHTLLVGDSSKEGEDERDSDEQAPLVRMTRVAKPPLPVASPVSASSGDGTVPRGTARAFAGRGTSVVRIDVDEWVPPVVVREAPIMVNSDDEFPPMRGGSAPLNVARSDFDFAKEKHLSSSIATTNSLRPHVGASFDAIFCRSLTRIVARARRIASGARLRSGPVAAVDFSGLTDGESRPEKRKQKKKTKKQRDSAAVAGVPEISDFFPSVDKGAGALRVLMTPEFIVQSSSPSPRTVLLARQKINVPFAGSSSRIPLCTSAVIASVTPASGCLWSISSNARIAGR
ncbi:hypothetical protein DFH07DRAFT_765757 [Mycena maculata]|uniref:Uncharacterized protein n=1 Tax=Mycena maculata TaxID=230809 RepID=A0AAD7NXQ9_9AGAR|nr:hypothetical protein DFH07DRAFT_765757 [Mycena maculata]